jgi:hypothetical protein
LIDRILSLGERVAASLRDFSYDRMHAREAASAQAAYLKQWPDRALPAATERRVQDYSRDVLGSGRFAPWLQTHAVIHGSFIEGWIPDNFLGRVVLPRLQNPRSKRVTGAKTLARRTLHSEHFPDRAYHVRGCWLDRDGRPLDRSRIAATLFEDGDTVFVKKDRGSRGTGVFMLRRGVFDLARLESFGDFAVQSAIQQHEAFACVMPDTAAKLRVTTTKSWGEPAIARCSSVRFGRTGDEIVTYATEIEIPVVDPSGRLLERGLTPEWTSLERHPDSGVRFSDVVVPSFEKACRICCELHDSIPHLVMIGWDLGIDREGEVQIMEWNTGHIGTIIPQALIGACFKDLGWEKLKDPSFVLEPVARATF